MLPSMGRRGNINLSNELQKKKKETIAAKKRQYLLKKNLTKEKRRLQDAPKACSKLRERVLKGAR
jgi:hypothetical protein